MKKIMMGLLIAGMAAVGPAWGQEKKVNTSLNLGVQTNIWQGTSFDNAWFTLDLRVGVSLGASWEISPEVMYAVDDSFDFSWNNLYPGILVNYRSGGFFVGAGAVLPIGFGEGDSATGNISPKINAGYNFGKLKLTAYFLVLSDSGISLFDMNQAGITLGYRF
ncbi:MAG: hypothetical protein QUS35_10725 [bacterium]|nr:hypothetical protein [bacterium]